jgi:NADP-dependent 3-hydroxy acid dehydrogenase YdfG
MAADLKGKVVLITGASAGVGHAAALAFAARGAKVVATARRAQRLEALCAEIQASGGEAVFYAGDAVEEATAIAAVALATERFGRLDILVNNAGMGNYKNLVDTSVAEYDEMMDANVRSGFVFSRHAAPVMIAQGIGEILFVSSIAGLQGYGGEAVYCATKFAQVGFAQALDAELRRHGIKVGCLCPGGIKTEFALGKGRTEDSVAASNMMDPADVADAVVYACSQPANARILEMTIRHMG